MTKCSYLKKLKSPPKVIYFKINISFSMEEENAENGDFVDIKVRKWKTRKAIEFFA